jgi:hypothetical protein
MDMPNGTLVTGMVWTFFDPSSPNYIRGLDAVTVTNDNTTYFGEGVDANASPDKVAGDVMHELLHSLGFTDKAIQTAFFGHTTYYTGNISDRLATDCFGSNGKGR